MIREGDEPDSHQIISPMNGEPTYWSGRSGWMGRSSEIFQMRQLISLALVFAFCGLSHAQWGTLKGQFIYGGKSAPKPNKLTITKDVEVCGKEDLFSEQLVVNEKNRGIANVVIWAYRPKKIHSDYKATEKVEVKMDNLKCRFEPHVVAVRTGQTLNVTNSDPVGHNSLIGFIKNPGVNPIIPANGNVEFQLKKAELLPVKVSCSIHPWMQGLVLVQDHPYMAVTDEDGKFEIKNLPAGDVALKVWHEKSGYVQAADVDGKAAKWKRGRYSVKLASGKTEEHTYTLDPKMFEK